MMYNADLKAAHTPCVCKYLVYSLVIIVHTSPCDYGSHLTGQSFCPVGGLENTRVPVHESVHHQPSTIAGRPEQGTTQVLEPGRGQKP
eukprot:1178005-Prorocentrum_minimum.AAC.7